MLLLAAGCVRFHPEPLSPGRTAEEFESRSLTNTALESFLRRNLREPAVWPTTNWDFEMLTLAAFYYQPSLAVARADWRVAQGGTKTAAARPNPSVTVTPAYDSQVPGTPSPWIVPVTFDLPVETAGKRRHRIDQAAQLSEAARLNLIAAAWQTRGDLRSALVDFVAAQQRDRLLQEQVSLQRELAGRLNRQREAGAIANAEMATAGAALAKAGADSADARRQLAEARVRLAEAIGIPASALQGVTFEFDLSRAPASDPLRSADARGLALRGRADILAALADYAASQSALQVEIAKQYPDLHLGPGYAWNAGNAGDNQWELGLTLELPLLNRNQGPIAEAEARRAASAARFIALQAKIIAEIERAAAGYRAAENGLAALQSLASEQENHYETIRAQLQAGASDQLELLGARLDYNSALLAELDAQVKFQQAAGALENALQRPMEKVMPAVTAGSPGAAEARKTP